MEFGFKKNALTMRAEEYPAIENDVKECKKNLDRLEWFLANLVKHFQSEYHCGLN